MEKEIHYDQNSSGGSVDWKEIRTSTKHSMKLKDLLLNK